MAYLSASKGESRGRTSRPSADATTRSTTLDGLITLAEAARRIDHKAKTLHNWISNGTLRGAQGLYKVGRRPMIHWPTFEKAFVRKAN